MENHSNNVFFICQITLRMCPPLQPNPHPGKKFRLRICFCFNPEFINFHKMFNHTTFVTLQRCLSLLSDPSLFTTSLSSLISLCPSGLGNVILIQKGLIVIWLFLSIFPGLRIIHLNGDASFAPGCQRDGSRLHICHAETAAHDHQ